MVERDGFKVAFVGFSTYRWSAPMSSDAAVRRLVRAAARRAPVVVAMFHAGAEGADKTRVPGGREHAFGEDRGDSRHFARAAIDAGADLVVGSGPHVVRGLELYRGRLIAYSLGNLTGYRNFSTARDERPQRPPAPSRSTPTAPRPRSRSPRCGSTGSGSRTSTAAARPSG